MTDCLTLETSLTTAYTRKNPLESTKRSATRGQCHHVAPIESITYRSLQFFTCCLGVSGAHSQKNTSAYKCLISNDATCHKMPRVAENGTCGRLAKSHMPRPHVPRVSIDTWRVALWIAHHTRNQVERPTGKILQTGNFLQLGKTGGKMGFESRSPTLAAVKTIGTVWLLFFVLPTGFWVFIFWLLGAFD